MLEVQKQNSSFQSEISKFKIVLMGNVIVGKTSLVIRFAKGYFNPLQENTIGAAFFTQTVYVDGRTVKLEMWDTAGQERYKSIVRFFYRGTQAAIVVYDITDEETFEGAKEWIKQLQKELGPDIPIILAGNKQDLDDLRMVQSEEAQVYADENKLIFMETSAKTSLNVTEMFLVIAKKLSAKKEQFAGSGLGTKRLTGRNTEAKTSGRCCK